MNKEIKATITISIDAQQLKELFTPAKKERPRNDDPNAHHNKYKYPDPELMALRDQIWIHDKKLIAEMAGVSHTMVNKCLEGRRKNSKVTASAKKVIENRKKLLRIA